MTQPIKRYRFPNGIWKENNRDVVIDIETGQLVEWPYDHEPTNFSYSKDNAIHDHPDPTTWSQKTRQGECANNFFETEPNTLLKPTSIPTFTTIGSKTCTVKNTNYRSNEIPTSRKRKNKKGKKIKDKRRKDKRRKNKIYKKELKQALCETTPIKVVCDFCQKHSGESNIYWEPQWYTKCDFCDIIYEHNRDLGMHLCESCAYNHSVGFCTGCEQNLGPWTNNWRDLRGIPHKNNCACYRCIVWCSVCNNYDDHKTYECPNLTHKSPWLDELPCFLCEHSDHQINNCAYECVPIVRENAQYRELIYYNNRCEAEYQYWINF